MGVVVRSALAAPVGTDTAAAVDEVRSSVTGTVVAPWVVTWTGPNGDVIDLFHWQDGYGQSGGSDPTGFGSAEFEASWIDAPVGSVFSTGRFLPRVLMWPQLVLGTDQPDFDAKLNRLRKAFYHGARGELGPGRLTVRRFDGRVRWVDAYYLSGLADGPRSTALHWQTPIAVTAPVPFWRGATVDVPVYQLVRTPVPYYPILPRHVEPDTVGGDYSVTNTGDVEVYSRVTLTGPFASGFTLSTAGRSLTLARQLLESDQPLVVDMSARTARSGDTNWRPFIPFGSSFFPLAPGANGLAVSVSGGSAATTMQVSFDPLFLAS